MGENTYFIDSDDERELARLQFQDQIFNEIIEVIPKQFLPFPGARVLDVACGPGGWPLQVAEAYPEISVVGVDISPQMIRYARAQAESRQLENVQFRIMDILKKPWDFPDHYFDLINMRFISGLTPVTTLDSLLQECERLLRSGGVLRNTEAAYLSAPISPGVQQSTVETSDAVYRAGLCFSPHDLSSNPVIGRNLKRMGFQDVCVIPSVLDLSHGTMLHQPIFQSMLVSLHLLEPFFAKTRGMSREEVREIIEQYMRDWNSPDFCAYWFLSSVCGTKEDSR